MYSLPIFKGPTKFEKKKLLHYIAILIRLFTDISV